MRENRTYGSEGGEAKAFPTPIRLGRRAGALDSRFRGNDKTLQDLILKTRLASPPQLFVSSASLRHLTTPREAGTSVVYGPSAEEGEKGTR